MVTNVVTVKAVLRFTAEARGKPTLRLLKRAGVPHLFAHKPASGGSACWTFPRMAIPDVMAAAETLKNVVLVVEHEQEALPL